ncbi:MAG: cytochrome d ubiquinol oxidase subunit II [Candidatus Kapaibacterium sp.]|jgi:cytochrome d ubiquinol oxidase subunit II
MATLWFAIIALMIAIYVILDGFDLGAGVLHLFLAKTDKERRTILQAIGPLWDGNEVWLIAAGGTLFFAFPTLYASSFSGFYLPLMLVLWLLILRGLGIEFRKHLESAMWHSFFDAMFAIASILLSIVFGAALGNVVRGVPLHADGYFFEAFWTSFFVIPEAGILDWYTVLLGLVSLATLANHGAHFLALKTDGALQLRAQNFSSKAIWAVALLSVVAAIATFTIRPEIPQKFSDQPIGIVFILMGVAGIAGMIYYRGRNRDMHAFLSSALFIAGMLCSTAFGVYPILLRSSIDEKYSLTIQNAAASEYGLGVGIIWWCVGMILVAGYFIYIYRTFRGKVTVAEDGY